MFAAFGILLCLLSVGMSTIPACEDLLRPRDALSPADLNGTWAFAAGSLNHSASMEALKQRDSITGALSFNNDTSAWSYTQVNRIEAQCQQMQYNITVEGSRFRFEVGERFSLSGSFLHSCCPDCLVMQWKVKAQRRQSTDLYLLTRRRILTQSEWAEFEEQLRCLQLPPAVRMDPFKELCPVEKMD